MTFENGLNLMKNGREKKNNQKLCKLENVNDLSLE